MVKSFDTYTDLRAGMLEVLRLAQSRLDVFDVSGSDIGFNKPEVIDVIKDLLRNPSTQVRIVVHDTSFIERDCPRLFGLLQFYGHQLSIHRTRAEIQSLRESLVIVDGVSLLRRYHSDHARGCVVMDDSAEISPWSTRFSEIWEASEPGVTFTQLGL